MKRKILMVLMGLDIGGAETHVAELSRELVRRGNEVVIVSNGGVYEQELIAQGVRCLHAPLHRRSLPLMLRSLAILRRVIREEKPDVVHAHARIPAFLCGILQRTMHFPFVTSAHAVFAVNGLLRRLSDWGEHTITVSEDIKRYLQDNYGVDDACVTMTVNGVDTTRFSPEAPPSREFGLADDRPTLVHVSRLDAETTFVTRQLLSLAPRLREAIPGLRLLIVGGGNVERELAAEAEACNAAAGERYIILTGARTDVPALLAAGDVFVGVSRAALEAMAVGKSVLLAGSEGYIGLFDETCEEKAKESNFCGRGCGLSDEETLFREIVRAFTALDADKRAALGRFGRAMVEREYSLARMADDAEAVYRKVLAARVRVVASGYYGFRNLGDDAILLALRDRLEELAPGAKLVALSNAPAQTRACCGVDAVYRYDPFAVRREIKRCTLFLSGGGSLLQDSTSTRSLLYYTLLVRVARRAGKRILFYANGIGPVRESKNRERVRAVAEMADAITLRDALSERELRAMGVKNPNVFVTADPVYATRAGTREEGEARLRALGVPDGSVIGVSVRFARGMETNVAEFARFCDALAERASVVFLGMQDPQDVQACEKVRALMERSAYLVQAPYDPAGMMGMIACMDAVVSTRLHSIIFAACVGTPVLGVVYDPKVEACLEELAMPSAGTLEGFSAERALAALEGVLSARERYAETLCERAAAARERAKENDRLLAALLGLEKVPKYEQKMLD